MARLPQGGDVTHLVLLGFLSCRPMHGYDVLRELRARNMEQWADVKPGSIYQGLHRLMSEGHIEAVGVSRDGRRPERTTYRITEHGRARLRELIRHAWRRDARIVSLADVALSFVEQISHSELGDLLAERIDELSASIDELEAAQRESAPSGLQMFVEDIFDHYRRWLTMELEWTRQIKMHLDDGLYPTSDCVRRHDDAVSMT